MQRRIPQQCLRQISTKAKTTEYIISTPESIVANLRSRNAYKKTYAARKKAKTDAYNDLAARGDDRYSFGRYKYALDNVKKTARLNRHEDWELGPLAPKRDVGAEAGVKFGSADLALVQLPDMKNELKHRRDAENKKARTGEKMGRVYKVHDRLVVIRGKFKGQIGSVIRVREGPQLVDLENINSVGISLSSFVSGEANKIARWNTPSQNSLQRRSRMTRLIA
jgi:large subunit ribosomal protein L24